MSAENVKDKLKGILDEAKKVIQKTEASTGISDLEDDSAEAEIDVEKLKDLVGSFKKKLAQASTPGLYIHPAVYVVAFVLIFSIIGFFSYRLIQSYQERERKREEKRRLKEEKKKKK